jgi:hypothetical protein
MRQHPPAPTSVNDPGEISTRPVTTLAGWLGHSWDNGLQIDQLEDLHAVRVETLNSTYDLAIVSARKGEILLRGGRYFPDWTPVLFLGCSLGGSLLKRLGIYPEFRLEFFWAGRLVMTSPVRAINSAPGARSDASTTGSQRDEGASHLSTDA